MISAQKFTRKCVATNNEREDFHCFGVSSARKVADSPDLTGVSTLKSGRFCEIATLSTFHFNARQQATFWSGKLFHDDDFRLLNPMLIFRFIPWNQQPSHPSCLTNCNLKHSRLLTIPISWPRLPIDCKFFLAIRPINLHKYISPF